MSEPEYRKKYEEYINKEKIYESYINQYRHIMQVIWTFASFSFPIAILILANTIWNRQNLDIFLCLILAFITILLIMIWYNLFKKWGFEAYIRRYVIWNFEKKAKIYNHYEIHKFINKFKNYKLPPSIRLNYLSVIFIFFYSLCWLIFIIYQYKFLFFSNCYENFFLILIVWILFYVYLFWLHCSYEYNENINIKNNTKENEKEKNILQDIEIELETFFRNN